MADRDKISSFDESGYFKGRCQLVFSENLAQEADEQDEFLASIPNGAEISIGRVLLTILQEAVLAKATYIHIHAIRTRSIRRGEFLVRYRIDGRLWVVSTFPAHVYASFCARLKIISSINIAERRVPQFGRFFYEQSGVFYEMRLSSIPTQSGEAFVISILQNHSSGSYAVDRHERQDQMTVEEIYARIQAKREKPE